MAKKQKTTAIRQKNHDRDKKQKCAVTSIQKHEGGEKTILQSNNIVALRVIYFHLDASKVWYGTIDITQ